MHYDKETWVMENNPLNMFYTWFLFKIDALPQEVLFPLNTAETFLNNLSTDVGEFLMSEGVQVPSMPPTETNN